MFKTYSLLTLKLCFILYQEFHRGQAQVLQGDMFLPAMRDFQAQATCRLAEAEDLFQDMKTRVKITKDFYLNCNTENFHFIMKILL